MRDLLPPAPPAGTAGDPGLFGPGSAAWRLGRERLLLAGGPAALLLQVAHPLVAAGVAAHSDVGHDPARRLRGTLDATLTVTFGDAEQVRSAAATVARRHRPVRGRLVTATGPFPAGTPYRADDPSLAQWVLATLTWTAVRVVEALLGPLPAATRDGYSADARHFGALFGADPADVPASWAALDRYVHRTAQTTLVVDARAAQLARQVLAPDPPVLPAPLRPLGPLLAAALLPPPIREAYALPWSRPRQAAFASLCRASRRATPLLPDQVRFWPHYLAAQRRLTA